jgi:hypothetical protein
MAVSYTKIYQDTTTIPGVAGAQFNVSNPIPAGLIEDFIITWQGTNGGPGVTASTLTTIISNLRCTLNGDQWFNFSSNVNSSALAVNSRIGSLVNDMGGYVAEQPSLTAIDCSLVIPCGVNVPANSRFEVDLTYFAVAAAANLFVGNFSIWCKYGSSSSATVTGNATSFPIAVNTQTLMTVAIPSFKGAKVSGIALQGTLGADNLQNCVVQNLGNFSMTPTYIRGASGASQNGYLLSSPLADAVGMVTSSFTAGYYFIPLYDLDAKGGSVNLLVTSVAGAALETYSATPILRLPTGGSGERVGTQTASKATGGAATILSRAEQ